MWTQPRGRPHFLSLALWPPESHLVQNSLEEMHWVAMWRLPNTLPTQLPWGCLWGRSYYIKTHTDTSLYLNYLFKDPDTAMS